ncbi:hypothetical protein MSAN_01385700 [Mycena sanguinolenta]|uniref:Uncharacterized protein n=1 Tax=Mycena sanguinolenta TaxID=230812 RepID=A0A8H7D0Z6_9AGAR|nr:hypothetical protein MSAN_01385700 [Mycena sanguinolenta]
MLSSSRSGPSAAVSDRSTTSAASISITLSATRSQSQPGPTLLASGGGGTGQGPQSALYLYTFLTTLILLLGASSAIIARSLMLRRRHWRMMAQLSNGSWILPARVSVDLCKPPQLWDAWVQPSMYAHGENEKDFWDGIMPFATAYSPCPSTTTPSVAASPALTTPETLATPTMKLPNVHVAVLIAMPAPGILLASPTTPQTPTWMLDNYELPHLEVGLASVAVKNTNGDGAERDVDGEYEDGGPVKM